MDRERPFLVLAHGGAEADPRHADGPRRAVEAALRALREGRDALDAAAEAVRVLESDERFNAGLGSALRLDGRTVHMDAALLDGRGRVASVIGLEDVEHPILVARDLLDTPHVTLAGPGATRFARRMGHPPFDPRTPRARERAERFAARLRGGGRTDAGWDLAGLLRAWNYPSEPLALEGGEAAAAPGSSDTVGALAFDGETFAAAASTGGLMGVLDGRVSDVAFPGCGLDANGHGAVCVSGAGERILRARVAARVLRRLEEGAGAERAAREALTWLPEGAPLALLVMDAQGGSAAMGRQPFPWARDGA